MRTGQLGPFAPSRLQQKAVEDGNAVCAGLGAAMNPRRTYTMTERQLHWLSHTAEKVTPLLAWYLAALNRLIATSWGNFFYWNMILFYLLVDLVSGRIGAQLNWAFPTLTLLSVALGSFFAAWYVLDGL